MEINADLYIGLWLGKDWKGLDVTSQPIYRNYISVRVRLSTIRLL